MTPIIELSQLKIGDTIAYHEPDGHEHYYVVLSFHDRCVEAEKIYATGSSSIGTRWRFYGFKYFPEKRWFIL
jgi:hypothetical protein